MSTGTSLSGGDVDPSPSIASALADDCLRSVDRIVGCLSGPEPTSEDGLLEPTLRLLCRSSLDGPVSIGLCGLSDGTSADAARPSLVAVLDLASVLTNGDSHVALVDADVACQLSIAFDVADRPGLADVAAARLPLAETMVDVSGFERTVLVPAGGNGLDVDRTVGADDAIAALLSANYDVGVWIGTGRNALAPPATSGFDAVVLIADAHHDAAVDLDRRIDDLVEFHQLPVGVILVGIDAGSIPGSAEARLNGEALVRERGSRAAKDIAAALTQAWAPPVHARPSATWSAVVPDEL